MKLEFHFVTADGHSKIRQDWNYKMILWWKRPRTVPPNPVVLHTRVVTGAGGGPEKTILNSPRYLQRYGIRSTCLFMRPAGDPGFQILQEKARLAGAPIVAVDDSGPLDLNVLRECVRICRDLNVTVWHGHDYKSDLLGLLAACYHPMHLVTTAHGWVHFTSRTPFYYALDRLCMSQYDQIVCVSQDLYRRCQWLPVRRRRLHQVNNAIVVEDYQTAPPATADRARFGFDSSHLVIGAVGRLSEEKGFDHLINAVSHLIREGHQIGLLIAGDGPLKQQLQQQINQLDLQSHVRLLGFLNDPRQLYQAVDLFVLSSLREGLPNVVLEAMASGRPVVATRCNGVPAIIEDNRNGLIVEPNDPVALMTAIRRMVLSASLRSQFAVAGRKTIEDRFAFDRRMHQIVQIYRGLSTSMSRAISEHPRNPENHQVI
ncbi:MAG: glycosyltransferase, partial [Planctomycetaceae bacterium]|nr:glycosyltransferase [Planctomycetaceae bacterium]